VYVIYRAWRREAAAAPIKLLKRMRTGFQMRWKGAYDRVASVLGVEGRGGEAEVGGEEGAGGLEAKDTFKDTLKDTFLATAAASGAALLRELMYDDVALLQTAVEELEALIEVRSHVGCRV